MIEKMFPQTVSNILDYDAIKAGAKAYVEDVFVKIVESFGNNLVLQSMDKEHLSVVARNVSGNASMSSEELIDYINTDNVYREFQFVDDLKKAFPEGVEYLEFEVTGWGFPDSDFEPFTSADRSYKPDGTPDSIYYDSIWRQNAENGNPEANLLMSRYGAMIQGDDGNLKRKSGRRSSWGNSKTWMTTGGFGKPATIHINVDSERTVIEENGLSAVENWLGTVAYKLPINLYIEINDNFNVESDRFGSSDGYYMSFPYEEEETFCQRDNSQEPKVQVTPEPPTPQIQESGWMTGTEDETFAAPRCEFDMSSLELVYGGGTELWMNEIVN